MRGLKYNEWMKKINTLLLLILISCSHKSTGPFTETHGCFLLFNLKTKKYENKTGTLCEERFPASSTFKIPLALMALDSGVLKDEHQIINWDGEKGMLDAWNKDQNAFTWMKESVVWVSKVIYPKLGAARVHDYLKQFNYGNQDISSGNAPWLNSITDERGALKINAYEQVEFLTRLWTNQLNISLRAMEITRNITYLETSPNGFRLSGKTGSNKFNDERTLHLGWFVAHVSNGDKEYIAVTNIADIKETDPKDFGGYRAKDLTKNMLKKFNLW